MSCIEPITRYHTSDHNRTHDLIPWRPNVGYENIQVTPL